MRDYTYRQVGYLTFLGSPTSLSTGPKIQQSREYRTVTMCSYGGFLVPLHHAAGVVNWSGKVVIFKAFFRQILLADAVWGWGNCIHHEFKDTFEENQLDRVSQSFSAVCRLHLLSNALEIKEKRVSKSYEKESFRFIERSKRKTLFYVNFNLFRTVN